MYLCVRGIAFASFLFNFLCWFVLGFDTKWFRRFISDWLVSWKYEPPDVTLNGMLFSNFFVMPFWYLPPACLPCPWHFGKVCRDLTVVYWSMALTSMVCFYHPKTWKVGQEKIVCLALYPFHTFSECLHSPTSEIKQYNFILIEAWRVEKVNSNVTSFTAYF